MDLKQQIANIKIIDHHCHAFDHYYWNEAVGVYPFLEVTSRLPIPSRLTPLSRAKMLLTAYRELYNFPYSKITPENQMELDELFQRSKTGEAQMYYRAMDKAGIESAVEICLSKPELPPELDSKRFKRAQLVDGFIIPLDNSGLMKGIPERAQQFIIMCEAFPKSVRKQINPTSFDEYLRLISSMLEKLRKQGCVAIKVNYAYWRDIAVDVVEEDEARDVYTSQDTSPLRYKQLQDFLLRHLFAQAAKLEIPIQVHTGSIFVSRPINESNPSHLDPFLWLPDIKDAEIVLLHGGYPYCREAGFMASRGGMAPKVYLDISLIWWWHSGSPKALVRQLREWLELGLAEKMLFGSDGVDPLTIWMGAINAREGLYLALKGMIDAGIIDDSQAIDIAQLILHDNAKKLYKI
jgi:predicted TIM-barrel fold metal-dependent hydrolase